MRFGINFTSTPRARAQQAEAVAQERKRLRAEEERKREKARHDRAWRELIEQVTPAIHAEWAARGYEVKSLRWPLMRPDIVHGARWTVKGKSTAGQKLRTECRLEGTTVKFEMIVDD